MNIDRAKLESLTAEQLEELLYSIAISMGAKEAKARQTAAKAGAFKKMLANASDSELSKIVGIVGEEKAKKMLDDVTRIDSGK